MTIQCIYLNGRLWKAYTSLEMHAMRLYSHTVSLPLLLLSINHTHGGVAGKNTQLCSHLRSHNPQPPDKLFVPVALYTLPKISNASSWLLGSGQSIERVLAYLLRSTLVFSLAMRSCAQQKHRRIAPHVACNVTL